jgi:hypothetical protein
MNKKIIARNGNKILVKYYGDREVAGCIQPFVKYCIWNNEEKFDMDISSEIINDKYYVYCDSILKISDEKTIINLFLKK